MGIYQHYRKEEHSFIDQVLSWQEFVKTRYQAKLTDFLDPREQQIVESVIGKTNDEIQLRIHSGTEHLERKRLIIAPFYEDVTRSEERRVGKECRARGSEGHEKDDENTS